VPFTQEEQMILMFAALLHDVGKPSTTQELDGRITSRGHAEAGVELARQFLKDNVICDTVEEENAICILVQEHMAHAGMGKNPSRKAVKRLVKRLADNGVTMEMWYALVQADHYGRPPLPRETPIAADKVYAEAFAQQCEYDGKKLYEV
jgi:tRNA nucleotidyltransferase (CCA-adding enzyme)